MILVRTVSMFSGYMGPRASKDAFSASSAIAGGGDVHFDPILARFWPDFGPILYGDFGHFDDEFEQKKAPIGLNPPPPFMM